MVYRSVYGYIWQLVDTSYLIRILREFLRTRLLPISSWGDSVLEKSTMGGTVVSICIMFSPPLTHLLINPLTLWKILPFSETNMQIVQPSLPSWPCMAFASYSSSLIDLFCNISTHTSHKHSWVLWHQQHTCSHTFNFRLHSLWRPCPEEAWSHFFLWYTSLIFHYKFKHSSFTH